MVSTQTWPLMCQIRTLPKTVASKDFTKIKPARLLSPLKNLMSMKVMTMWPLHSTLKSCSKRHSLGRAARGVKPLLPKEVEAAVHISKASLPAVIMQAVLLKAGIIRQSLEVTVRRNCKTLMMLLLTVLPMWAQAPSKKRATSLV